MDVVEQGLQEENWEMMREWLRDRNHCPNTGYDEGE